MKIHKDKKTKTKPLLKSRRLSDNHPTILQILSRDEGVGSKKCPFMKSTSHASKCPRCLQMLSAECLEGWFDAERLYCFNPSFQTFYSLSVTGEGEVFAKKNVNLPITLS